MLPGSRQADVGDAAVIPAEADVEPDGIEAADVDTGTARVEIHATNVDVLEQSLPGGEEVADHGVDHDPSGRRLLVFREECLLLVPRLRRRVGDRRLANEVPADLALVLGERLSVVPVLVVEQGLAGLLGDATNVQDREREHRNENVRVLHGHERLFGERYLGEVRELLLRRADPEVLNCFLDAKAVLPHDLAGALLGGRRLVALVETESCYTSGNSLIRQDLFNNPVCLVIESSQQGVDRSLNPSGG